MTIAVSCCLADGAIVGADSAITLSSEHGILKVYNDAEKIFPLFDLRVGLVAYGLAALGARTIKSYALEFELENDVDDLRSLPMSALATRLLGFSSHKIRRRDWARSSRKRTTPV